MSYGVERPNVALGALDAANVAFGALDAANATLGRFSPRVVCARPERVVRDAQRPQRSVRDVGFGRTGVANATFATPHTGDRHRGDISNATSCPEGALRDVE
ncbi:hypothetical protein GCM10023192_15420 [Amycolatopsis samaneae]